MNKIRHYDTPTGAAVMWEGRLPKRAKMEGCRQFARAVVLVPVSISYDLLQYLD